MVTEMINKTEFPEKALEQAANAKKIRTSAYLTKRNDLRGKTIFAFSESADTPSEYAFSVSKLNGGWMVGIHIADVCEYVPQNSPLDLEARERCSYIRNGYQSIPMLPKEISHELCNFSLKEDKLAISIYLEIRPSGKLESIRFEESIIAPCCTCVYSELDRLRITSDSSAVMSLRKKYANFNEAFEDMYEMAALFCVDRLKRKGLDCDNISRVYRRNGEGKIDSYELAKEPDSRVMVREILYFAAQAIGEYMHEKGLPCIFSGRKTIPLFMLYDLKDLVGLTDNVEDPEILASLIAEKAKGTDKYDFVCDTLASCLPAAQYSVNPINNFFCGSDKIITLFTPVTKYAHLLMQRMLKHIIEAKGEAYNLNINRMRNMMEAPIEKLNKCEDYLHSARRSFRMDCAFEYLECNRAKQHKGYVLYKDNGGSYHAVLLSGSMAIIPAEFTQDIELEPAKLYNFEVYILDKEKNEVLLKPINVSRETI